MNKNGKELSERKKIILKAIIDAHISGGEPVGSKYLTMNKQIALSSATIRNEMAELEELGYLEQPHTSAGRVPSELGYRFYVNSLMESYRLTSQDLRQLNNLLGEHVAELDKLLEKASKVMAALTNYTTLAVKTKPKRVVIIRYKTVYLEIRSFLLVMITSVNIVNTKYVRSPSDVNEKLLERLEDILNRYLCGVTMEDVTLPLIMEAEAMAGDAGPLVSPVIKCIYEVISEIDGELKIEGVNRLLQYPEYSDVQRLRSLLNMLEKKDDILNVVSNSQRDITNIFIGSENTVDIMHNSTLIFKTITYNERMVGAIGVIGPCRMDYSKVVSTVEYLSRKIADLVREHNRGAKLLGGDGNEGEKEKENGPNSDR